MILVALVPVTTTKPLENELWMLRGKDKSKPKVPILTFPTFFTFRYICINGICITSFLIMDDFLLIIWNVIGHSVSAIYMFTKSIYR